jgi:hypothetical protein
MLVISELWCLEYKRQQVLMGKSCAGAGWNDSVSACAWLTNSGVPSHILLLWTGGQFIFYSWLIDTIEFLQNIKKSLQSSLG